jgi:hypothetical protein
MVESIKETMRSIHRKAENAEIRLGESYEAAGCKNPEVMAHIDSVIGTEKDISSVSPTPKTNPNFPGPRPGTGNGLG